MAIETLYAQADPQDLDSYVVTTEGGATYSVNFTVAIAGVAKEIWCYSPPGGLTDGALPNYVGIFVSENETPIVVVDSPTWSGGDKAGWISATIPDTDVSPGTTYFACIGIDGTMNQAYLYEGSTQWIPATSEGGNISTVASTAFLTLGPDGPAQSYHNAAGFPYPDSAAPSPLNWLVDVGVDFVPVGPPSIETTDFPVASRQLSYSSTLEGSSGTTPYAWSVTAGSLPAGLSLDESSGAVTGTPTVNGISDFTVTLTDADSLTDTADLSITVQTIIVSDPSTTDGISTYSVAAGINNTADSGPQDVRVLPPVSPAEGRPHAFLWVLSVEPGQGADYGDGIGTMKTLGVHDTYNLTCIQPGFPVDPWYVDSDTDPQTQQDSYVMALVDWAEANLSSSGTEKHFLIGFSKSGFGGQEMFWHHQDVFSAVSSWDAATDYETMDQYDGADSIGSQDNLTANELYNPNLTTWKAEGNTGSVRRIFLSAGINLVEATSDYAARLTSDEIMHSYVEVITDSHAWAPTPGWVAPAVEAMLGTPIVKTAILGAAFI